ncbi:MAG: FAD-dependent oxidoreductase [Bacteroidota bacterium]|nr:FAD-dependent oxidoreductase [Bacteroidota bacterium]
MVDFHNLNMEADKPIAIIGAGLAGLTAANFLRSNNIPFILYESGKKIAGLATSFKDDEGFSHDFGAHFITNRLAKAIGINSDCILVKHYGEAVWYKGKSYNYPFGLIKVPKMFQSWFENLLKSIGRSSKPASAADWFRKRYGSTLADEIALPLLEAWSGEDAKYLSPAVGDGLFGGGILKTIYLKTAGKLTGRAVSCGYNREKPETPGVWHVYPVNGISTLCEKLAEGLEDSIYLESPVQEILVENEKAVAVIVNGEKKEVSGVISTAPANILSKLVKGTAALQGAKHFRYRPMVFVNMRFTGRKLLPDTVMWFPEKNFSFFRLTEATQSMPWLAPDGKTIITADIGCEKDDAIWSMDSTKLTDICLNNLEAIVSDIRDRFLGSNILRTTIAYPVFLNEYEKERQDFEKSTNIENLLSVGRNGEFSHMFMEDVYWRTQKKVQDLIQTMKKNNESSSNLQHI